MSIWALGCCDSTCDDVGTLTSCLGMGLPPSWLSETLDVWVLLLETMSRRTPTFRSKATPRTVVPRLSQLSSGFTRTLTPLVIHRHMDKHTSTRISLQQ